MVKTLVETYNKKLKKYCNSGNRERKQARSRATTGNVTLQPIKEAVNDETNEKDDRNTSDHGASNSNSIAMATAETKSKQEPEQSQAMRPYIRYKMLSMIKLMKKIIETQTITMPAIATQTLGGLNASIFHC